MKDLLKPFIQVISYLLIGTFANGGRVVFPSISSKDIPSINNKYVFVLESDPNSSCHKTTSSITDEFDREEYIVLTSMYRYKKFDESALQGRLYPIESFIEFYCINPLLFLKYWLHYVCIECKSERIRGVYFNIWLLSRLSEVFLYIQSFKVILGKSPKAVVNTKEKFPMAASATHVSNNKNIATFFVEHSITKENDGFTYNYPLISDYVMVYGKMSKNWYLRRGVEEDRIVVSGQPRYDNLFGSIGGVESDTTKRVEKKRNKIRVMLATQPFEKAVLKRQVKSVCNELSSIKKGIELCIKPHPRDDVKLIKNFIPKNSRANLINKNSNILECIKSSECIVTYTSNVGLESLALETPVIITNYIKNNRTPIYCDRDVAMCANKPGDISKYLLDLLRGENDHTDWKKIRNFVNLRIDKKNGKSSKFVEKMIKRLSDHDKFNKQT